MQRPATVHDLDRSVRRTERVLAVVRLLSGVWAVGMVVTYPDYPEAYGDLVQRFSLGVVGAFMAGAVVLWLALELGRLAPRRAAAAGLVLDALTATSIAFAYGFDITSAVWIILFLLPVEGAMRFQLRGAALAYGISLAGYVGRAYTWEALVGQDPEVRSIIFRMTVVGIVTVFVGIISEQLRQEREVAQTALAQVQRSDQWRARLVSALGHDLRSPLATVEMQARAVRDAPLSDEQRTMMLDGITRQARRLTRLAEGLLDMAMADRATLDLRLGRVEVAQVVEDALDLMAMGDEVDVVLEPGLAVIADEDRLAQVVLNLVGNARKYGAPAIELVAVAAGDHLVLTVRDHGPGVPDEQKAVLFDEFAKGDQDGAIGLGLYLVLAIVEAHGGTVAVEDADPGARFVVRLPGVQVEPRGPAHGDVEADEVTSPA